MTTYSSLGYVFKKRIFFLLFLVCGGPLFAGNPVIDSMMHAAARMPVDTNKVKSIIKLVFKLQHGDPRLAFTYTDSMLLLSQKLNYRKGIAYAHHYYGILYTDQKAFSRALENLQKADSIYKVMNDLPHSCNILNSTGNIYYHMKDYDRAMDYYKQAVDQFRKIGDAAGMAMEMNNMGSIFSEKKELDKALYYYQQALDLRVREKDTSGICSTLGSVGEINDFKGSDSVALSYYRQGLELSRVARDRFYEMNMYGRFASFYDRRSRPDSAIKYSKLVLQLSKETFDADEIKEAYGMLNRLYEQRGQLAPAYQYYKSYIALRDSLNTEENAQKFAQAEMNFKFAEQEAAAKAEQEKKNAIDLKKKQTNALIRNAFIAGLIVLLLLGIFISRGYTQQRRDNIQLERQNIEITRQKREIEDSINYAKYIQDALLPGISSVEGLFPEAFVLFRPKDVVSGDFYWMERNRGTGSGTEYIYFAAGDCTGHGVPGAFMSMIAANKLNSIMSSPGDHEPGEMLSELNTRLIDSLKQEKSGYTSRDGMDIALCRLDLANGKLDFAGANRPLWIIRGSELITVEPDKNAIGGYTVPGTVFSTTRIDLRKGDMIYVFSDGFADQFGGDKDKKFTSKRFRELLLSVSGLSMQEQKIKLERMHLEWKSGHMQTDDILIMGVRIS